MTQESSYHIKSIASNVESEIKRLKAQVELFWDSELKHYVEFGLRDRDVSHRARGRPWLRCRKDCRMFSSEL